MAHKLYEFIEVPLFAHCWEEIGLTIDDLFALQDALLENPHIGPVIEGTGGLRKMRFAVGHKGKSGGIRVCYTEFEEYEVIHLITAFSKSDQENLTAEEKQILRKLVQALKDEHRNKRRNLDE